MDLTTASKPSSTIRYSVVLENLRKQGCTKLADEIETVLTERAPKCETHGNLGDPVMVLAKLGIMFACPFCSGESVLKRWRAEGPS